MPFDKNEVTNTNWDLSDIPGDEKIVAYYGTHPNTNTATYADSRSLYYLHTSAKKYILGPTDVIEVLPQAVKNLVKPQEGSYDYVAPKSDWLNGKFTNIKH